jgi:hypothetical protein
MALAKSIDIAVLRQRLRKAVERLECGLCHLKIVMVTSEIVRGHPPNLAEGREYLLGHDAYRGQSTNSNMHLVFASCG